MTMDITPTFDAGLENRNPRVLVSGFSLDGHDELRVAAVVGGGGHERLIGTASVKNAGQVAATLYQLHVVAGWRGQGVGTAMVEAACREAGALGSVAMSAVVEKGGPVGFWAGLGFSPVHVEGGVVVVSRALVGGTVDRSSNSTAAKG